MSEFAEMAGMAAPLMPTDPVSLAGLDCSDRGNAARFVARYGDRFLFVRSQGWYAYTGTHWTRQGSEAIILNAAAATVAAIVDEAKALEDAAKRHDASLAGDKAAAMMKRVDVLRKWATQAGSINRIKGLLSVAEAKLVAELEDFDTDPLAINCPNGTIRFVRARKSDANLAPGDNGDKWEARLDAHDPADRITRVTAYPYDASATAPEWTKHLEKMVPNGKERRYLQTQMGYCALGTTREQCFFMHQGRGGDGKSVTFNTIRRVLGTYATTADIKTFLESKSGRGGAEASPDLARLSGATRLVCTEEPPRGARLNEGLLKLFTGGAPILARNLNKDPFEFLPRGKIVMQLNPKPHIGGADDGIWRRIKIMLWRVQLQRSEMDPDLENRLVQNEGAGVMAWIVWGALVYLTAGELMPPESVEEAISDYKRSSNVIGEWMSECIVRDAEAVELMADLYQSYKDFCERNGYEPISQKALGATLGDQQITMTTREPRTRKARRKGARVRRHDEIAEAEVPEERGFRSPERVEAA